MLTTDRPVTRPTHHADRLRQVLLMNATTSGLGGIAALLFVGPVADLLGVDRVGWVRLVGAGLVAFAAYVVWVARSPEPRLRRETPMICVGDGVWVVGTVATIALGWYSTRGSVAMGVVGVIVGAYGVAQLALVRALGSDD